MATRATLAARTTAALTGGGTADYGADLDMNLSEDSFVTVEVTPTVALLDTIHLSLHCGPAATPVGTIGDGIAPLYYSLPTGVMHSVTVKCCARYFRAAVTGTGAGGPVGSDAVVNYYYSPKASTHTTATQVTTNVDGMPQLAAGVISHA